jgi:hypothetical protein
MLRFRHGSAPLFASRLAISWDATIWEEAEPVMTARKALRSIARNEHGVTATAVAVRGMSWSNAISPK